MDLGVWACPVCWSDLSESTNALVCRSEGRSFRQLGNLAVLVPPEQEVILDQWQQFAAAWKKTKWAVSRELVHRLPYVRRPGWKQKAQSLRKLLEVLGPAKSRKVVDAGAGTGWLSNRLSEVGFRCFATDVSWDADVGLGAISTFDEPQPVFERAVATLDNWPFRSASIDIAICNASLHYLSDPRHALAESLRVLRRGGTFVLMNSPVHSDARSATRASQDFRVRMQGLGGSPSLMAGYKHFVGEDLEKILGDYLAFVRRHDPCYGFVFDTGRRIKGRILRMNVASFPIYEGRSAVVLLG
jgi:SAM-dependent methyltransferase